MSGDLVGNLAERIDEVPRDFEAFAYVRNALPSYRTSRVRPIDKRQIVRGNPDGEPLRLRAACALELVFCQGQRPSQIVDRSYGIA
jgi:hypothetical protein